MKHNKIKLLALSLLVLSLLSSCGEGDSSSKETSTQESKSESVSSPSSSDASISVSETTSENSGINEGVTFSTLYTFTDGKREDVCVAGYRGTNPVLNIVEEPDKNIQFVLWKAFAENEIIKEVSFPDTIFCVDTHAFALCKNLEKVSLGEGLKEIKDNAFINCFNLKSVDFGDKLEKIGDQAFLSCKALEEITIPPSCVEISISAFAGTHENFKIKGKAGSYAETYAKENNIAFEANEF